MSSLSDDRKNHYHIEIPRQLSQSLWKLLEENYDLIITRQQHTPDGKDLHIELKVAKAKQSLKE